MWGPAKQPSRKVQLHRWIIKHQFFTTTLPATLSLPPSADHPHRTTARLCSKSDSCSSEAWRKYGRAGTKGLRKTTKKKRKKQGKTNSRSPEHGESVTLLLCVLAELARNLSGLRKLLCQVLQNVFRKNLKLNTVICMIVLLHTHCCDKTLLQNCDQRHVSDWISSNLPLGFCNSQNNVGN